MTKFKNLKTGVVWEIDDAELILHLKANHDYAEVFKTKKARKS